MSFTITIGHWIFPVVVTIAIWVLVIWKANRTMGRDAFAVIGNAAVGLFYAFVGVTCTLATWLVYVVLLLYTKG